ncbi:MAG: 2Fe-2S iron-sulfur cluster-binding protein, partial [Candidatus Methylumidiphilus sp.]
MLADSLKDRSVFSIDGQEIPFQPGQTVLQAAMAAGLAIPHLCYRPELEPIGSCRLCLVELSGRKLSACTLPASDGLMVQSDNPSLRKLR